MRRSILVAIVVTALLMAFAAPAAAMTPANDGMGKMFGDHIRTEAQAGTLGKLVHPGMHHGMAGWEMPMP